MSSRIRAAIDRCTRTDSSSMSMDTSDTLKQEVAQIWDQNADYWDQQMGRPAATTSTSCSSNRRRCDCWNSREARPFSMSPVATATCRKMAALGAKIVAVDASQKMIQRAQARSAGYEGRIEYRIMDCTNREQLLSLGERRFDRIVCTMALMDMCIRKYRLRW